MVCRRDGCEVCALHLVGAAFPRKYDVCMVFETKDLLDWVRAFVGARI